MQFDVIKNRRQAVKFCLGISERLISDDGRWRSITEQFVQTDLSSSARGAIQLVKDWLKSPNKQNRAKVKRIGNHLQQMTDNSDDTGILLPLMHFKSSGCAGETPEV